LHDDRLEKVRTTDEGRHETRCRPPVDDTRRSHLLDATRIHYGDPVGDGHRFRLVVSHEDCCNPEFLLKAPHLHSGAVAELRIEIGEGLVKK
jgi:hypothetical protein